MNLITQYGRALYGARWQSLMADDLGVNERTVRRWGKGEFEPPDGVWDDLRKLARTKAKALLALPSPD